MKKSELIKKLQEIPEDLECILAINRSAGFPDDYIEFYPIESVYKDDIYEIKETTEKDTAYSGYCEEEENPNKIVMYVYP